MTALTGFYGNLSIPNAKREELEGRMLEVMRCGGLAKLEHVSMFGRDIDLVCQPSWQQNGNVSVTYSYFEDKLIEEAFFNKHNFVFYCSEYVTGELAAVIDALVVLAEFYSDEFAISSFGEAVSDEQRAIGWLNHLFKENYTNKRVEDLGEIYRLMSEASHHTVSRDLSYLTRVSMGGRSKKMMDNALDYLLNEDVRLTRSRERLSPTETARDYILALREIRDNGEMDGVEKLEMLKKEFLQLDRNTLEPVHKLIGSDVTAGIYTLPRDFAVKVLAMTFRLEPETLVDELRETPEDISHIWYSEEGLKAIPAIKTSVYFGNMTDDDLAYYWRYDSDEVVFSKDMENWITALKDEFDDIAVSITPRPGTLFLEELMATLEDANRQFVHIYAHREMFFEFVERMGEVRIQAAVTLLRRIMDRGLPTPPEGSLYEWEFGVSKLRRSEARLQVKRYLSIMANPELRRLRFGF